jgi:hypothetical protein
LHIVGDETSSPAGQKTIIDWQRETMFGGRGSAGDMNDSNLPDSWKKRQIKPAIADFLVGNPGARASDYFLSLGMTCKPATAASRDGVTRCEIELPIWVECISKNLWFPGGAPVPKELRKPIPALLHMSVNVSTVAMLDVSTRVEPIPGGRLCHR